MHRLTTDQQERIDRLVGQMSLEERAAQLTGVGLGDLLDDQQHISSAKMGEHLSAGIGMITLSAGETQLPPQRTAANANAIQRYLVEETSHGIPAIFNDECIAGFVSMAATHFPQAIGMGAAWDPDLTQRMADVIRRQARAVGSRLMYSPVFDLGCDPRWGRTEETWGEDPYLASRIGVAFVKGLHGEDLNSGVLATLKHFAAYSVSEGGRNCGPVHMGPRELREVFLLPFEAAVKEAGALSVMAAYHDIDGVPCAASHELLTEILRQEWGFEGIVVADWGVVEMLHVFHHICTDRTGAAKLALSAGLDVEAPSPRCYPELVEAVRRGEFDEEIINCAVRRHLTVKTLLGLLDDPYVEEREAAKVFDVSEHRALALKAARAGITLLKNDSGLLPLAKSVRCLAVIGPNADDTHALLGDYSYSVYRRGFEGDAVSIVSVLEGIRSKVSDRTEVRYARGCEVMDSSRAGFDEAIQIAAQAEVIVAVLGGKSALHENGTSGENLDRAEIGLPGAQEELLKALHATGKPVVLILVNGRPLAIEWAAQNAAAIIEAWLPGEEGGNAVADVLFGDLNPGGKLPVSLLRTVGQAPTPYHVRPSSIAEGGYVFTERSPLYPFGHGLSYTTFSYDDLRISPEAVSDQDYVRISCRVANTGDRPGDEVVQLYVRDPVASVSRPRKELKGFARIALAPGQQKRLTFNLPIELLSYYDLKMKLVVEAGEIKVMLGSSSEDTRLEGDFVLQRAHHFSGRQHFHTSVKVGD